MSAAAAVVSARIKATALSAIFGEFSGNYPSLEGSSLCVPARTVFATFISLAGPRVDHTGRRAVTIRTRAPARRVKAWLRTARVFV